MAMPGVKAILTADDLPAPADTLTDIGTVINANKLGEQALTMEPVYQGEPILAVAAVDEYAAAKRSRRSTSNTSGCRSSSIRWRLCGPVARTRTEGNVWVRAPAPSPGEEQRPAVPLIRRAQVDGS